MPRKPPRSYRLTEETIRQLTELSRRLDRPRTWVVERAVRGFYRHFFNNQETGK